MIRLVSNPERLCPAYAWVANKVEAVALEAQYDSVVPQGAKFALVGSAKLGIYILFSGAACGH